MKALAPDRIVSPGIAAGHGHGTAGRLQAPLGPAHEAARRVRLVKLQRVDVLAFTPFELVQAHLKIDRLVLENISTRKTPVVPA